MLSIDKIGNEQGAGKKNAKRLITRAACGSCRGEAAASDFISRLPCAMNPMRNVDVERHVRATAETWAERGISG